ncbi:hypothetical protein [Candidiatus Paracoxiella cheracis]|uniref:hypothetical protein n=1 Tax=Candidiatus Paracoxiella cheracis TaxID=3405120 RepID=UPI003BF4C820
MLATEKLKQFRTFLYNIFPARRDANMNLLDALSSHGHRCPMRAMERRSRWRVFRGSRRFLTERSAEGTEFRRQRSEWQKSVGGVESSGDSAQSAARSRSAVDGDVRGYLGCRVLRVDY